MARGQFRSSRNRSSSQRRTRGIERGRQDGRDRNLKRERERTSFLQEREHDRRRPTGTRTHSRSRTPNFRACRCRFDIDIAKPAEIIVVRDYDAGRIIGRAGHTLKKIQDDTETQIEVQSSHEAGNEQPQGDDHLPNCRGSRTSVAGNPAVGGLGKRPQDRHNAQRLGRSMARISTQAWICIRRVVVRPRR